MGENFYCHNCHNDCVTVPMCHSDVEKHSNGIAYEKAFC